MAAPAFLETIGAEPPLPPRFAFVRTPVWDKADADDPRGVRGPGVKLWASRPPSIDLPDALCRGLGRPAHHHGRRHGA